MASLARNMSGIIDTNGNIKAGVIDNSNSVSVRLTAYSTLDSLPTSALTSGDQAFVSENNRIYVSNGAGWYNVALLNATPTLNISPSGAIELATDGSTPTVITLTGADSDTSLAVLSYSVESDGSFGGLAALSQDSSVFTITPLADGVATTSSSTLTFKVSDGINFGAGTTQFSLLFYPQWDYNPHTETFSTYTTSGPYQQESDRIYLSGSGYNGGILGVAAAASAFKLLKSPWTFEYEANRDGVNSSPFPSYSSFLTRATTATSAILNGPANNGFCMTTIGNAYGCYAYIYNSAGSTVYNSGALATTYAIAGARHRWVFDNDTFNLKLYGAANGSNTFTLLINYTFTSTEKSDWLSSYEETDFRIALNTRANNDGWRNMRWYTQ